MPAWGLGFRRLETVDSYLGVLVPLEKAHKYSHSAKAGMAEFEDSDYVVDEDIEARLSAADRYDRASTDEIDGLDDGKGNDENEAQGMLQMNAAEYTIEGLRAEMRKGQGGGPHGTWTSFESGCPSIYQRRMTVY